MYLSATRNKKRRKKNQLKKKPSTGLTASDFSATTDNVPPTLITTNENINIPSTDDNIPPNISENATEPLSAGEPVNVFVKLLSKYENGVNCQTKKIKRKLARLFEEKFIISDEGKSIKQLLNEYEGPINIRNKGPLRIENICVDNGDEISAKRFVAHESLINQRTWWTNRFVSHAKSFGTTVKQNKSWFLIFGADPHWMAKTGANKDDSAGIKHCIIGSIDPKYDETIDQVIDSLGNIAREQAHFIAENKPKNIATQMQHVQYLRDNGQITETQYGQKMQKLVYANNISTLMDASTNICVDIDDDDDDDDGDDD